MNASWLNKLSYGLHLISPTRRVEFKWLRFYLTKDKFKIFNLVKIIFIIIDFFSLYTNNVKKMCTERPDEMNRLKEFSTCCTIVVNFCTKNYYSNFIHKTINILSKYDKR